MILMVSFGGLNIEVIQYFFYYGVCYLINLNKTVICGIKFPPTKVPIEMNVSKVKLV